MKNYLVSKTRGLFIKYDDIIIIFVAMAIGVAAGLGNIVFRSLIHFIQKLFFGIESEVVLYGLQNTPIWKIILVPAFGGLLVGLISKYLKLKKSHGVAEVIKAITLGRVMSPVTAVVKTITSAITLGTGGSAGREGPIVQIGAAIGSTIGQVFKFSSSRMSTATACGAAGALAATFNAPMAGAMFAAEILLGQFGIKSFSPVIIAAVTATAVSRAYYGNEVTFIAPEYVLKSFAELPLYAILGIVVAIVSILFIRFYYKVEEYFDNLQIPDFIKPAIGGLLMGLIAVFCRNIMGVGYGTISEILNGQMTGYFLLILIILKILATSLTLGSGGSGGQFVPSLFIGAATGGFFGYIVSMIFPSLVGGMGTYGLVAMSAMLAAVMHAPITAIFIIFEITQSYQIILPVMICAIIANVIANKLETDSIFTWTLSKEGFKLNKGVEHNILGSILVKEVMLTDIITFKECTTYKEMKEDIARKPLSYFPVVTDEGILTGMISLNDLKKGIFKNELSDNIVASQLGARKHIITVSPDATLEEAIKIFSIKEIGALPVVLETEKGMKLLGLLKQTDMITAYNKKLIDI